MVDTISEMSSPPSSTTDQLNQREVFDFKEYRQQLFWWLLNHGKDPEKGVGYAEATVESLRYRRRYIAERSAVLFLAGGSLLLVTATLLAIEAVTGVSTQGLLTGVTGFTGIILTYIGLLALEPWFANRVPRVARMGYLLVLLPTIVIVVLLVWGMAHHLPIGTVPSPIGVAPMDLIFMATFLLFSIGVGLFGLVSLRTNFPSWHVGLLLLALATTWIGLLVLSSVFGSKLPTVIDFISFAMMAGISLSIGYLLRDYQMPSGYPEVASDMKG